MTTVYWPTRGLGGRDGELVGWGIGRTKVVCFVNAVSLLLAENHR